LQRLTFRLRSDGPRALRAEPCVFLKPLVRHGVLPWTPGTPCDPSWLCQLDTYSHLGLALLSRSCRVGYQQSSSSLLLPRAHLPQHARVIPIDPLTGEFLTTKLHDHHDIKGDLLMGRW
jgi:hypothetical protein